MSNDWNWERHLKDMFNEVDKDKSGYIGKEDVMLMLMNQDKDAKDVTYKAKINFLVTAIREADKDKDSKISFEEFKAYIDKAT